MARELFRNRTLTGFLLSLGIAAAIFMAPAPANATLGEAEESVRSDQAALAANGTSATPRTGYTVREIVSDAVTVREYVSPTGVIFAIAWNGLIHPDLKTLLGAYAGEYENSLRGAKHEPGRRRLQLKTGRVVVEKWGHMRDLQGRAYVPALLPSGVSVDEIK